jgi:hypothetical protein
MPPERGRNLKTEMKNLAYSNEQWADDTAASHIQTYQEMLLDGYSEAHAQRVLHDYAKERHGEWDTPTYERYRNTVNKVICLPI